MFVFQLTQFFCEFGNQIVENPIRRKYRCVCHFKEISVKFWKRPLLQGKLTFFFKKTDFLAIMEGEYFATEIYIKV